MNWLRLFRVCFAALSNRSSARRLGISLFGALILAGDCVPHVRGELITFQFSGTVSNVMVIGWPLYPDDIDFPDVGDPVTGFYTFDSNSLDIADSPDAGSFRTVLPETALGLSIAATQLEGRAVRIDAVRNIFAPPRNIYGASGGIELTSDPALAQIFNRNLFALNIAGEDLFSDPNVLPLTPPSLDGTAHLMTISMDSGFNTLPEPLVLVRASLDTLTLVPEPSHLLLAGIGFISSLGLIRRRRSW